MRRVEWQSAAGIERGHRRAAGDETDLGGRGVDTAIEAVGISATFELCQDSIADTSAQAKDTRALKVIISA